MPPRIAILGRLARLVRLTLANDDGLGKKRQNDKTTLAVFGVLYIQPRARHMPVSERRELVTKGHARLCATCRMLWPCEVGQALDLVGWVLVRG